MKILNAEEIKAWDQYTIEHEPVTSINLMERAATKCVDWLSSNGFTEHSFSIFCGKGNNGGDGLAIARLLSQKKIPVTVFILEFGHKGTTDFQTNLARLHEYPGTEIRFIQTTENFRDFQEDEIIIDALFGSGLNRAIEGVTASLIGHINHSGRKIISIDIPSGLFVDRSSLGNVIVKADHTLSFQCYKPALLVAENSGFTGEVQILEIGLHPAYYGSLRTRFESIDLTTIHRIYRRRNPFAHKGDFGHSLLLAGSKGKIGAAVLAAKACLRSGTGLLTCHVPNCGIEILQTAVPEAMTDPDKGQDINTIIEISLETFQSVGIGPGIGTAEKTNKLMHHVFDTYKKPMVIDADALNILSQDKSLLKKLPQDSILTPHPKEFERLFGKTTDEFERIELAMEKASELKSVIVLKGHHSFIAANVQDGKKHKGSFNITGNAGMATGGSGDVLTGILTGLLAQGYPSFNAALLGVFLHGLSGDLAARKISQEALIASDLIDHLGLAFLTISRE